MTEQEKKPFDFWNDHSLEFLEMAYKRDYQEKLESCDGYGKKTRSCGDTIEIFILVQDEIIQSISYDLKGCLFSHACVNTLIKLAKENTFEQAERIKAGDIIDFLQTLPKEEEHCADHVLAAFNQALDDHIKNSS